MVYKNESGIRRIRVNRCFYALIGCTWPKAYWHIERSTDCGFAMFYVNHRREIEAHTIATFT